jgi:predicted DNA-binding transcriptional regulator AlpA
MTQPAKQIELMGTEEIAKLLGVSRAHCVSRIIKRPDFPQPAIDLSQRLRRWHRGDVLKWVGLVK